ncbi:DNA/RNA-binding domain of Phe-tRNA-synthetase-like protein [Micromonospora luteifusca]|uniref:DNA/RNA-binding domain of Phe-tRNA-synthetase-like protein n=1 Tax=Micromonospora luteifusca TaxID=709860 RepID=A0ABS2M2Y9_9ACTN|nr:phenylalanine--tRNA ligase beta subunit-related protein [Micromonospora luteifusca]MBM7494751.1 DNA/RNA-binding domain of Phe-tRNA-synthetase-like protein [Micromonospora luteifusca]
MRFQHSAQLRAAYPDLVAGVVLATGITSTADVAQRIAAHTAVARDRLANGSESGFPEIQAWRRAYAAMGLRPTRYRCAAEALLRRLRLDDELPRLHPLVDLCNAASAAYAIPVAAPDLDRVDGDLVVRPAHGEEEYLSPPSTPRPALTPRPPVARTVRRCHRGRGGGSRGSSRRTSRRRWPAHAR